MRHPIREIPRALRAYGQHSAADAFVASVTLARQVVPLNGFTLPEDLRLVDAIGETHFGRREAGGQYADALAVVPDLRTRNAIEEGVTAVLIAEYQTYYWYGLAHALVLVEPVAPRRMTRWRRP